jgi:hypothetical protein
MNSQSCGIHNWANLRIFGSPSEESHEFKFVTLVVTHKVYYKKGGNGFFQI